MSDDDLDEGLVESTDDAPAEPENHFPTMYVFVEDYLVHVYAHEIRAQITEPRWCPCWWEHPEAVARVEALWKAFEVQRLDAGTGMSVWFRDHADPCMAVLLAASGPFSQCDAENHKVRPPLPVVAAPDWLINRPGSTSG